jgi:hypothetical protein
MGGAEVGSFDIADSRIRNRGIRLLLEGMSKGTQYQWVVPDPRKTRLISRIARTIEVPQEELQRECDDGFLKLQRLYQQANVRGIAHRMRVLLSSMEPSGRYYLFDHRKAEGAVIYTPYIFGVRSSHSPALVLPASSQAARRYIDSCVAYAEASSEYSFAPHRKPASQSRRFQEKTRTGLVRKTAKPAR